MPALTCDIPHKDCVQIGTHISCCTPKNKNGCDKT